MACRLKDGSAFNLMTGTGWLALALCGASIGVFWCYERWAGKRAAAFIAANGPDAAEPQAAAYSDTASLAASDSSVPRHGGGGGSDVSDGGGDGGAGRGAELSNTQPAVA